LDPADLVSSPQVTLVVFATLRIVTALFLKETLSTAANDAEMVIEDSRRFALQYQKKLEALGKNKKQSWD